MPHKVSKACLRLFFLESMPVFFCSTHSRRSFSVFAVLPLHRFFATSYAFCLIFGFRFSWPWLVLAVLALPSTFLPSTVPLPPLHWSTLLLRLNRVLSQQLQYQSHVAGRKGYQSPVCAAPRSMRTTRVFCRSSQVLRLTTPSRNRPTFATLSRHATVSARVGRGCSSPTGHSVSCPAIPAVPATDGTLSLKILSSNSSIVSNSHSFSQESCRSS